MCLNNFTSNYKMCMGKLYLVHRMVGRSSSTLKVPIIRIQSVLPFTETLMNTKLQELEKEENQNQRVN